MPAVPTFAGDETGRVVCAGRTALGSVGAGVENVNALAGATLPCPVLVVTEATLPPDGAAIAEPTLAGVKRKRPLSSRMADHCDVEVLCPTPKPAPWRTPSMGGVVDAIKLPQWAMPKTTRSFALHFSIVAQLDGLMAKCRGMGARIARDVLATSELSALCHVHGYDPWMSTGSFCGLYLCDFEFMPRVVATVATHRGHGVFIVPVVPNMRPALSILTSTERAGEVHHYGWYNHLLSKAIMTFELPVGAFTSIAGDPIRHPYGVQAVFAQFGQGGYFKARPRPERAFKLQVLPRLTGPKLGIRPALHHMVSPSSWDAGPLRSEDTVPPSPAFAVKPDVALPRPLLSRWGPAIPEFNLVAADFPCPEVARLALECMTTGLNPYKGKLDKPVLFEARPDLDDAAEMAKRATLLKETVLQPPRIMGPLKSCPFAAARVCPTATTPKDPYDPTSQRLRLISNFSKRAKGQDKGSVNDLCWSPKLLSFHANAAHIRDNLAWLFLLFGAGVQAWTADIPSCFRLNHLHPSLLSLFVYRLLTQQHGEEWFVDLATPFGWTPAEWGWQCILALILWAFTIADLAEMFAFVDNFFFLFHPCAGGPSKADLFARIENVFRGLHVPLHEQMCGTSFSGLGWMWDTSPVDGPPFMICADDKYAYLCGQLPIWAAADELPFSQIESVIGFLDWISFGFPLGKPQLAHLRGELNAHRTTKGGRPPLDAAWDACRWSN